MWFSSFWLHLFTDCVNWIASQNRILLRKLDSQTCSKQRKMGNAVATCRNIDHNAVLPHHHTPNAKTLTTTRDTETNINKSITDRQDHPLAVIAPPIAPVVAHTDNIVDKNHMNEKTDSNPITSPTESHRSSRPSRPRVLALHGVDDDRLPLLQAVVDGDTDTLQHLIAHNADVNASNFYGDHALFLAAGRGYTAVVQILLDARADVDASSDGFHTPLVAAVHGHHQPIADILIDAKANVDVFDGLHDSPLIFACTHNRIRLVQALIEARANLDIRNSQGNAPLHIAAAHGHLEIVRVLLAARAPLESANLKWQSPLWTAAAHGHVDMVQLLLDAKANVTVRSDVGDSVMAAAAAHGHVAVLKLLLTVSPRSVLTPNIFGHLPLHCAVLAGHVFAEGVLLEATDAHLAAQPAEDQHTDTTSLCTSATVTRRCPPLVLPNLLMHAKDVKSNKRYQSV